MLAIRARFDGRALIPEHPVELPRDRMPIVYVETEDTHQAKDSFLHPVLTPSDPDAARRLIRDAESGLENL